MAKIICYPITCSSDSEVDVRRLFAWGEWESAQWLPTSKEEAKRRIKKCREKNQCQYCDAQIHKIEIKRTKRTYLQDILKKTGGKTRRLRKPKETLKESAGRVKITCKQCGKEFWVYKSQADRKYCSKKCFGASRNI